MANEVKLGTIPGEDCERDAVHVAVIPLIAAHDMWPGHRVGVNRESRADSQATPHLGIVDPFLPGAITAGTRFYLCLFPGTVTGMRQHWEHPAFTPEAQAYDALNYSIEWLKSAAVKLGVAYEDLIGDTSALVNGDYINNGEHIRDVWYGLEDEFWSHHEIVTGKKTPCRDRGGITCSC